jgi:hypothetical protein
MRRWPEMVAWMWKEMVGVEEKERKNKTVEKIMTGGTHFVVF